MARLPRGIQKQVEQAEALEAQLAQEAAQVAAPVSIEQALAPSLEPPTQAAPAQAPAPAPAPVPTPAPAEQPNVWEARYKVLQGKYNAEVPSLAAQVRELREKLQTVTAAPPPPAAEPKPTVDPKDVEDFGKDLVDMVTRNATRQIAQFASQYQGRLEAVEQAITRLTHGVTVASQTAAYTAEEQFLANLKREVPDFEAVNVNAQFIAWLAEKDPIYGRSRQDALNEASDAYDASRAAAVFKAFKQQFAAPPAPTPSALEAQVAPTASGGSLPAPAAPSKPYLTTKQINDFYNDVARGRYRGREQENARIEAEVNLAVQEGRVIS